MRFDDEFANGKYIPGGDAYVPRWQARAAAFRAAAGPRLRSALAYGPGARQTFDLYVPDGAPAGLVVLIHGGYWLAFGPADFAHLAAGALARGWACAMPSYTLAPAARIAEMTREIGQATTAAAALVDGPVVVTGHSAGGHHAARMACADAPVGPDVARRIRRALPVSPLSDLRPLIETAMNADLQLDPAEARSESPALLPRRPATGVHVWVGSDERPRFLDQARRLGNAWSCPVTVEPGRHHFSVIEGYEDAGSPLMAALLD